MRTSHCFRKLSAWFLHFRHVPLFNLNSKTLCRELEMKQRGKRMRHDMEENEERGNDENPGLHGALLVPILTVNSLRILF